MIYLASPYTHPDITIRNARRNAVAYAAGRLIRQGHNIYCPVIHSLALFEWGQYNGSTLWAAWKDFDLEFVRKCDMFAILPLEGWQESVGVTAEFEYATRFEKPRFFVNQKTFKLELIRKVYVTER